MTTGLMAFGLISLMGCLVYVVVGVIHGYQKERRLERDREDVDRLTRRLKGPDL